MEKMEVEKKVEEVVEEKPVKAKKKTTKWICDNALFVKKCEACGAEMLGYAYRTKFAYCPICGAEAEEAL